MRHPLARAACATVLAVLPASSFALDRQRPHLGEKECRVVNTSPYNDLTSTWSGGCTDGFANGTGRLEWQRPSGRVLSYEGGMKDGLMHGTGFLDRADNQQYEGEFAGGRFHGKGTRVSWEGYYEGDFQAGQPHGTGKMKYSLGGEYEGEWLNGVPHGKGTANYLGGRTVTGEWINGLRAGNASAPAAGKYKLKVFEQRTIASARIPFDKGYAGMSEAEKEIVRASYFLDENDEPAYPLVGTGPLVEEVLKTASKYGIGLRTELVLFVDVDAEGAATKVSVYSTPAPALSNVAAFHAMKQKYKPARCAGQPCAGKFIVMVR